VSDPDPVIMQILAGMMVILAAGYVVWFFVDYVKNGPSSGPFR